MAIPISKVVTRATATNVIAEAQGYPPSSQPPRYPCSPALQPLPRTRFELPEWKNVGVNIDYHFEFDHHFYSVPHPLVGTRVDVRAATTIVEAFHKGRRVASTAQL